MESKSSRLEGKRLYALLILTVFVVSVPISTGFATKDVQVPQAEKEARRMICNNPQTLCEPGGIGETLILGWRYIVIEVHNLIVPSDLWDIETYTYREQLVEDYKSRIPHMEDPKPAKETELDLIKV